MDKCHYYVFDRKLILANGLHCCMLDTPDFEKVEKYAEASPDYYTLVLKGNRLLTTLDTLSKHEGHRVALERTNVWRKHGEDG